MLILLVLISGWAAYGCDLLIIYLIDNFGLLNGNVVAVFSLRSLTYLLNIFLVTRLQMTKEAELRGAGYEIAPDKIDFWYSSICHYVSHYLVPSLVRVFSELLPLTVFIVVAIGGYPDLISQFTVVLIAVLAYFFAYFFIQKKFSKNAAMVVSQFIRKLVDLNEVQRETYKHSQTDRQFLGDRKKESASQFINANSVAVAFSQSIRYQLELVVVLAFVLGSPVFNSQAAGIYLLYRVANSSFQAVSIISSIVHYREFYVHMKSAHPRSQIFGDRILRLFGS